MSGALDYTAAARLLWQHRETGKALDALPSALRPTDQAAGHAIQAMLSTVTGRGVVGWKIAATSVAGQAHIGVSGPLAGRVLEGLVDGDGDVVSLSGNLMCVAEPEFAFRFGHPLTPRPSLYTVPEVLEAVDALLPSIEVPNSRFHDFARAGEAQLIADDACAHRFAIGSPTATDWRTIDLRMHRVQAEVRSADGSLRTTREGDGTAVLGDHAMDIEDDLFSIIDEGVLERVLSPKAMPESMDIKSGVDCVDASKSIRQMARGNLPDLGGFLIALTLGFDDGVGRLWFTQPSL